MGFVLKKMLSEGISTNTLKAVFHKNIQLHFLLSRVWQHLLSVSWIMGLRQGSSIPTPSCALVPPFCKWELSTDATFL